MIIPLVLLASVVILSARLQWKGIQEQYITREVTQTVNGIFILYVFISHFTSYIDQNSMLTQPFVAFNQQFRQLCVVPFLLYSGYGVAVSIKNGGGVH